MMNKEEMLMLLRGRKSNEWNTYRKRNPEWVPNLSGFDLRDADLAPAETKPFDLSRANLCGAKMPPLELLSYEQRTIKLEAAIYDATTIWPDGFSPADHGAQFLSLGELQRFAKVESQTVFISYAWANEDVVLALDEWLRSKNLKTRIDRRDFFAGTRLRDEIIRVMQSCDVILIFYSANSSQKPWTEFERELASDMEMEAKREGRKPPRIIYVVIDETPLPSVSERNRLAVQAKGKRFEFVCEELYHHILELERAPTKIDLTKWQDFVF